MLQYPDSYSDIMFPINVSIAEVDDTAIGELQSKFSVDKLAVYTCIYFVYVCM